MNLRKKETEEQRLIRCKEQYGCDGQCYNQIDADGNFIGMCGVIDICDETRKGEFFASVFIVICAIILSPIFLLFVIVDWIYDRIGKII